MVEVRAKWFVKHVREPVGYISWDGKGSNTISDCPTKTSSTEQGAGLEFGPLEYEHRECREHRGRRERLGNKKC